MYLKQDLTIRERAHSLEVVTVNYPRILCGVT